MEAPIANAGLPTGDVNSKKPAELLRVPTDKSEPVSLNKRRSLRLRPTEQSDKEATASRAPLRENAKPTGLQSRPSKMSLFNLFSKPKVEKLRGHSEQALTSSRSNIDLRAAKQAAVITPRETDSEATKSRTSGPKTLSTKASRMTLKEPPPASSNKEIKPGPSDPLPLFQAWPQAIKHAVLEVSTITSDLLSQQSKSRQSTTMQLSNFDNSTRDGADDSTGLKGEAVATSPTGSGAPVNAKSSSKHMSKGSLSTIELPRKLFILSTTGCILQYSEKGSSDRAPEKILQLGKDSAAFACDLIPGRLHVLEILQCVNEKGGMANGSGSILHKFGIRSAAARRQTSNFLLVMEDAAALASWMSTVRKQIEIQGGKRARPDSVTRRPKTANAEAADLDLKKVPSNSHRYQVRRDPAKVASIISPTLDKKFFESPLASPIQIITQAESLETGPVELSAEGEVKGGDDASSRLRGNSDSGSLGSSDSASVDQQHLDKLRESTRMSHTSTANTSATSRTNSLTSSPPVEQLLIAARDGTQDAVPAKLPYRSSSSYSLSKRRSVLPSPKDSATSPEMRRPTPLLIQQQLNVEAPIDSPVLGHHALMPDASPRKPLSAMQSAPDLKTVAEVGEMHDFTQPTSPVPTSVSSRPISFVAELPTSPIWATKSSPNLRLSIASAKAAHDGGSGSPQQQSPPKRISTSDSDPLRSGRNSAQSFSLPLRANEVTSPKLVTRFARSDSQDDLVSPVAAVHTLEAKVDPAQRRTISPMHIPPRTSSNFSPPISVLSFESNIIRQSTSTRLSLFPSALPSPPISADRLHRSPSTSALMTLGNYQALAVQASNTPSLRRPTSMQIRSDRAPFLANVRSPAQATATPQPANAMRNGMPVPIRSLKPSRSGIPTYNPSASPTPGAGSRRESLLPTPLPLPQPRTSISSPNLLLLAKEAADQRMSLVQLQANQAATWSPPQKMIMRRQSARPPSRAVLPELDFGIPLVGLGPPAPPPSAPLPKIPSMASRTRGPGSVLGGSLDGSSDGDSRAGSATPTTPPRLPLTGLGIEVGGS
ncbi:uncharacterized protein K489DRAFT_409361 [Dissoconium aciculare CBS 342.82]|uniref:PH domain-containing protein n=1 Tax=Dissoconium aciculare CBS 342.82 TaxID=1314786 RepID=A0A6J3M6K1_9PEZI|nr:uncharacterized protein K489DRAFT_409361 [Dissoconium aciculare CBS 342.82]KAF1823523.1 hypothetical protein K489DRAFT_409361 [Dissoconium aciculare CBS 342.82]